MAVFQILKSYLLNLCSLLFSKFNYIVDKAFMAYYANEKRYEDRFKIHYTNKSEDIVYYARIFNIDIENL